jgi:hypothetical protein
MEVTVKLLENAMRVVLQSKTGEGWGDGRGRFLIDGFPRKMDQALKYEEDVGVILSNLHRPACSSMRLLTVWWCDVILFYLGVHLVTGAVFHRGRGHDVAASAETR